MRKMAMGTEIKNRLNDSFISLNIPLHIMKYPSGIFIFDVSPEARSMVPPWTESPKGISVVHQPLKSIILIIYNHLPSDSLAIAKIR